MTPLSVIIPVGGGRLTNLNNCLYALVRQTLAPELFEVIVVSDGAEDNMLDVLRAFNGALDLRYVHSRKFEPGQDAPPRNKGAKLARFPHLVFLDSDVILDSRALSYYAEDFAHNPTGVVAGMYDWLPPCRIGMREIDAGLDSIYHIPDGENLVLKIKQQPWPKGHQTHNVARDMRRPMFGETDRHTVYTGPGNMNVYLGMFSGNLGFAAESFWKAGGYWEDLTAGLVDDGAFGLTFWALSVERSPDMKIVYDAAGQPTIRPEFGVRLDERIVGAHQYHDRNVEFVQRQSAREVDLINRRFRLEQYADGGDPILPAPVYALTEEAQKSWGVDKWKKDW